MCVDALPTCLCAMWVQYTWRSEEGVRSFGTGVAMWELTLGFLQEQSVPLIAEPTPAPSLFMLLHS